MSKEYLADNAGNYPVYSSQTSNNGEMGKINTFDYDAIGTAARWTSSSPAATNRIDAVECKWNPAGFEAGGPPFKLYPEGRNFLIPPSGTPAFTKDYDGLEVRVCTPSELQA